MKLKAVCLYVIDPKSVPNRETMEAALKQQPFSPCGPTEPQRVGWVPALDDDASAYIHEIAGTVGPWLLRLRCQRRQLSAAVVREQLQEQVAAIQELEGRKLGKKEISRLKDELMLTLLPRAFTKTDDTLVIFDPRNGYVIVATSSWARAELVLNAVRLCLGSFPVTKPGYLTPIPDTMKDWLSGEMLTPSGFDLGDNCELSDEEGVIRFTGVDLTSDEVRNPLEGRDVRRLGLVYQGGIRFTLLADGRLSRLRISDDMADSLSQNYGGDKLANLEAEFFLWSQVLLQAVPVLMNGLNYDRLTT